MADNNETQQDTQGAGQEHGQERETDQTTGSTPAVTAGAQEANTERDEATETSDVQALRHEAASRRRALRAVEAERDALREREDKRDRQTVERIATGRLADPADAWLAIGSLDELRGQDGVLDEALVGAGLDRIVQERPHWAKTARPNLHQGARQSERQAPSFGQALKGGGH